MTTPTGALGQCPHQPCNYNSSTGSQIRFKAQFCCPPAGSQACPQFPLEHSCVRRASVQGATAQELTILNPRLLMATGPWLGLGKPSKWQGPLRSLLRPVSAPLLPASSQKPWQGHKGRDMKSTWCRLGTLGHLSRTWGSQAWVPSLPGAHVD